MKTRLSLLSAMCVCVLTLSAQTVERSFYFDFGMNGSSRGEITTGADHNGNYWNNIGYKGVASNRPSKDSVYAVVDSKNTATALTVQLADVAFTANGMSGGGGLLTPDTALLGDLAVTTATEDYLFASNSEHCSLLFSGLDPQKGYQFKIFAGRTATDARISDYTFRGKIAIQGSLQAAGTGIGAAGENINTSETYLSPVMLPAADGTIRLTVHRQYAGSGAYFPINCMRMQEMTDLHKADNEIYVDCGHSDGNNGETTPSPDANGIYWVNLFDNAVTAEPVALTYSNGTAIGSTANVTITTAFSRNGYNNGGNTAETYSPLLGVFGQKSVAGDYFFVNNKVAAMKFNGLNPDKAYVFYVFGSRAYNNSFGQTVDKIKLEGLNQTTFTHHTGGNGMCYSGATNGWNEDAFSVSEPVFPAADGTLVLTLSGERGSYQHINAMRIEEYSDYQKPAPVVEETYTGIIMKGTAVESGSVSMMLRAPEGKTEGTSFETFVQITNGGTLQFETDKGVLLSEGTCALSNGIYRIVYNTTSRTYTSLLIERVALVGNITSAGWNAAGVALTYRGNGIWRDTLELTPYTGSDAERGQFCMNSSWDYTVKARDGKEGIVGFTLDQSDCGFSVEDIYIRHGKKEVILDMQRFTYQFNCIDVIDNKITFFGSSVCNGQGATDMHGYAYQFGQLLSARHTADSSLPKYEYSNTSINGNNTLNLLSRVQGHMFGDCGEYVVIGLGLGNEGLHEAADKQKTYDQWKQNMQTLISMAQAEGKKVVATNNYPRGDYNADDYQYVKRMNLEMQEWDIPTVNFLGALDNCKSNGQWADGYQVSGDIYHPTTEGHTEFMYTIVPSLFDAMELDKPKPQRQTTEGLALTAKDKFTFVPEETVHSYTMAIRVKTTAAGVAGVINTAAGPVNIEISALVADGNWHTILMSHYYAAGKTYMYVDGTNLSVEDGKQLLTSVQIGGLDMTVADVYFWRSALNADEVAALIAGKMLCSSLELYCPLSADNTDNLAQSTNKIVLTKGETTDIDIVEPAFQPVKIIENGQLVILKNGVHYNVLGAEIK